MEMSSMRFSRQETYFILFIFRLFLLRLLVIKMDWMLHTVSQRAVQSRSLTDRHRVGCSGPVHTKTIVNANASKRKLFYAFRPSFLMKTMKTLTVNA